MWSVECESHEVEKSILKKMIQSQELSDSDMRVISMWIRQVTFHGPESIRGDFKWADHKLDNEWEGYRSSAFSNQGRIIYRIENQKVKVIIARITPAHDYRK